MSGNPGGDSKIRGDDRREPVEFHRQLSDERVHSLEELKTALEPFEKSRFRREAFSSWDLDQYLRQDENLHWGNPQYRMANSEVEYVISLHYSPWLYVEEDILINGRIVQDHEIYFNYEEYKQAVENTLEDIEYIDKTLDGQEICSITIPKDPIMPDDFSKGLHNIQNSMWYNYRL